MILDTPHIGYYGEDGGSERYQYAFKDGSSWSIETTEYYSGYPSVSLGLDGDDRPHLALVVIDYGNAYRLKHASWDGEIWSYDTIDDDIDSCAIAVDNSDGIHIAYHQEEGSDSIIKYAMK